ncbi:hypothetical protein Tco_1232100 [Tanacetum coccineum]
MPYLVAQETPKPVEVEREHLYSTSANEINEKKPELKENTFILSCLLMVGDDEVIFDVDQSIKRPPTEDDECYGIDDLDDAINTEA